MKDDAISRRAVLKLLSTMPSEEAITKAMLIQSVQQMDAAQPKSYREGYQAGFKDAQPECAKDFVMLKVIDLNGRPYYSIIYLEDGCEYEGYSSYDLKVISEYLKRYFGFEQPEIIRCRECKYAEVADKEDSQDGYTCQFHRGSIWFSGSYCSWAERREVSK